MKNKPSEFARAGKRIQAKRKKLGMRPVKLSSKAYNTLGKRQAALKKLGARTVSTTKGGTRKTSRKAYTGMTKLSEIKKLAAKYKRSRSLRKYGKLVKKHGQGLARAIVAQSKKM